MDYLVDNIPGVGYLSDEWRTVLKQKAMGIFMWADWFCGTRDTREFIQNHTSFFLGEIVMTFCGLLTLVHAYRKGGRFLYLWIGIIVHGLNTECITYWVPDIDNFWHAQSNLMFVGRRLPLYVLIGLYPLYDYTASIAAKRLRLPWWAEGPAVGLGAVLLDIPYDILGVKLLWWTWHDTDPNIYDRMYWVPWTSYYFHASFACSFTWMLKLSRKLLVGDLYDWKKFPRELLCSVIAGMTAFWVGAAQFVPVYHIFHDYFHVHSECCVVAFLGFYAFLVWVADRHNENYEARPDPEERRYWFDELAVAVFIHYLFFICLSIVGQPETIVATGLFEPVGPCDQYTEIHTMSGLMLRKRKYLCPTRYDEKYFDFHCVPGGKPPRMKDDLPVEWYTICGTPFPNHMEYIFVVTAFSLFGMAVYYQCLARSGDTPVDPERKYKKKRE